MFVPSQGSTIIEIVSSEAVSIHITIPEKTIQSTFAEKITTRPFSLCPLCDTVFSNIIFSMVWESVPAFLKLQ